MFIKYKNIILLGLGIGFIIITVANAEQNAGFVKFKKIEDDKCKKRLEYNINIPSQLQFNLPF